MNLCFQQCLKQPGTGLESGLDQTCAFVGWMVSKLFRSHANKPPSPSSPNKPKRRGSNTSYKFVAPPAEKVHNKMSGIPHFMGNIFGHGGRRNAGQEQRDNKIVAKFFQMSKIAPNLLSSCIQLALPDLLFKNSSRREEGGRRRNLFI